MDDAWLYSIATLFQDADRWVLQGLNRLSGNGLLDQTVDFVCSNNFLRGTLPVGLYWYFWFSKNCDRSTRRGTLIKGVAATVLAVLAARGLAHLLPSRTRPFADPTSGYIPFLEPNGRSFEDWSSFPSDTAAYEFALCWSLLYISRGWSIFLLIYTTIFACLTRVYIGVHYPSDVVAGAMIGIVTSCCVQMVPVPRIVRSTYDSAEGAHPLFYLFAFYVTAELGQVFENIRDMRHFLWSASKTADSHMPLALAGLLALVAVVSLCAALMLWSRQRMSLPERHESGKDTRLPVQTGPLKQRMRPGTAFKDSEAARQSAHLSESFVTTNNNTVSN